MFDLAVSTVHWFVSSDDRAAEGLDDRLMAEANAKDWFAGLELLDHLQAHAGLVGIARPRGEHDGAGVEALDFFDRDCVIAHDFGFTTKLPKVPGKVVDKGVVVVDDQDHDWAMLPC